MLRQGLSVLGTPSLSSINRETLIKQFLKMPSEMSYFAKAAVSRLLIVFKNKTGKTFSIIRSQQMIITEKRNLIVGVSIFKSKVHIGTFPPYLWKERNIFISETFV